MVSIMVNMHSYKPSLHDIMEKYYEMFRGKNQGNDFFNSPDSPDKFHISEVSSSLSMLSVNDGRQK